MALKFGNRVQGEDGAEGEGKGDCDRNNHSSSQCGDRSLAWALFDDDDDDDDSTL